MKILEKSFLGIRDRKCKSPGAIETDRERSGGLEGSELQVKGRVLDSSRRQSQAQSR